MRSHIAVRMIAVILTATFVFQDIVWAHPDIASGTLQVQSLSNPVSPGIFYRGFAEAMVAVIARSTPDIASFSLSPRVEVKGRPWISVTPDFRNKEPIANGAYAIPVRVIDARSGASSSFFVAVFPDKSVKAADNKGDLCRPNSAAVDHVAAVPAVARTGLPGENAGDGLPDSGDRLLRKYKSRRPGAHPGSGSWGRIPALTALLNDIASRYGSRKTIGGPLQTGIEQKLFWSIDLALSCFVGFGAAAIITWSLFFSLHFVLRHAAGMPAAPPAHRVFLISAINAIALGFSPLFGPLQLMASFVLTTWAHLILNGEASPSLLKKDLLLLSKTLQGTASAGVRFIIAFIAGARIISITESDRDKAFGIRRVIADIDAASEAWRWVSVAELALCLKNDIRKWRRGDAGEALKVFADTAAAHAAGGDRDLMEELDYIALIASTDRIVADDPVASRLRLEVVARVENIASRLVKPLKAFEGNAVMAGKGSSGIIMGLPGKIFRLLGPAMGKVPELGIRRTEYRPASKRPRIIIVDNNSGTLERYSRRFGPVADVTIARTIDEARGIIEGSAAFDVLITDLNYNDSIWHALSTVPFGDLSVPRINAGYRLTLWAASLSRDKKPRRIIMHSTALSPYDPVERGVSLIMTQNLVSMKRHAEQCGAEFVSKDWTLKHAWEIAAAARIFARRALGRLSDNDDTASLYIFPFMIFDARLWRRAARIPLEAIRWVVSMARLFARAVIPKVTGTAAMPVSEQDRAIFVELSNSLDKIEKALAERKVRLASRLALGLSKYLEDTAGSSTAPLAKVLADTLIDGEVGGISVSTNLEIANALADGSRAALDGVLRRQRMAESVSLIRSACKATRYALSLVVQDAALLRISRNGSSLRLDTGLPAEIFIALGKPEAGPAVSADGGPKSPEDAGLAALYSASEHFWFMTRYARSEAARLSKWQHAVFTIAGPLANIMIPVISYFPLAVFCGWGANPFAPGGLSYSEIYIALAVIPNITFGLAQLIPIKIRHGEPVPGSRPRPETAGVIATVALLPIFLAALPYGFLHELGHFVALRIMGVRSARIDIGFSFKPSGRMRIISGSDGFMLGAGSRSSKTEAGVHKGGRDLDKAIREKFASIGGWRGARLLRAWEFVSDAPENRPTFALKVKKGNLAAALNGVRTVEKAFFSDRFLGVTYYYMIACGIFTAALKAIISSEAAFVFICAAAIGAVSGAVNSFILKNDMAALRSMLEESAPGSPAAMPEPEDSLPAGSESGIVAIMPGSAKIGAEGLPAGSPMPEVARHIWPDDAIKAFKHSVANMSYDLIYANHYIVAGDMLFVDQKTWQDRAEDLAPYMGRIVIADVKKDYDGMASFSWSAWTAHSILTMQAFPEAFRGKVVLDMGSGSDAVLSVVAARLGARRVIAIEKLPDAAEDSRNILKLNGVEVVEVRNADFSEIPGLIVPGSIDTVISNIRQNGYFDAGDNPDSVMTSDFDFQFAFERGHNRHWDVADALKPRWYIFTGYGIIDHMDGFEMARQAAYGLSAKGWETRIESEIHEGLTAVGLGSSIAYVMEREPQSAPAKIGTEFPEAPGSMRRIVEGPELSRNLVEGLLSRLLSGKKLTLIFDKRLGALQRGVSPLSLFRALEDLKKDPRFEKFLSGLTIEEAPAARLADKARKFAADADAEVFVFARDAAMIVDEAERGAIRAVESIERVRPVYVAENGIESDAYYPLAEIVTIALWQRIRSVGEVLADLKSRGIELSDINIASIDPVTDGPIVFRLLPSASRLQPAELADRYARLKEALIAA